MKIKFHAIILCIIVCFLCACGSNEEDINSLSDYRPMIFVNDIFYGDSGEVLSELPDGADSIGTILKTISQNEPMLEENFCSNNCPPGSEIYFDEETPEKIYIRITSASDEKYSVYEIID